MREAHPTAAVYRITNTNMSAKRPLKELLAAGEDEVMEDSSSIATEETSSNLEDAAIPKGICVECGDQPADLVCESCDEEFCQVCFDYIHRTGVC